MRETNTDYDYAATSLMFKLSSLCEFHYEIGWGRDIEIRAHYGRRRIPHHWDLLSLPEGLNKVNCSLELKYNSGKIKFEEILKLFKYFCFAVIFVGRPNCGPTGYSL